MTEVCLTYDSLNFIAKNFMEFHAIEWKSKRSAFDYFAFNSSLLSFQKSGNDVIGV